MITQTSRPKITRIFLPEQEVRPRSRSIFPDKHGRTKGDGPVDDSISVFNNAPVGYCVLNEKGKIIDINNTGLEMLGISYDKVQGKSFSSFIFPEDQDSYYLHRQKLLETSRPQAYELRLVRSDATEFSSMLAATLVIKADGDLRYHMVLTDISEHKRLQDEKARATLDSRRNKAQKAESVHRLAGGVAHSFNNMLGVISGYTEMALQQVLQEQPLHADLTKIKQAADRCAELTGQLLNFAGRQCVAPRIVNINEVIAKKLDTVREALDSTIQLHYHPTQELWPVKIDLVQLEQILNHLLENAGEAVGEAGTITIRTENQYIKTALADEQPRLPAGEYVQLSLSDDGCGIAQPVLEHIFEPFFTTKKNGAGLGLGLATVHEAVKQNRGHIEVKSTPDQGTIFTIYLPRHRNENQPTSAEMDEKLKPLSHNSSRITILLVDDKPIILEMIARLLEHQGYTIVKANNAEEALLITEEYAGIIDLLLTDVVMPGLNGDDLAKKLLLRYPTMKCLFMSGYAIDVVTGRGLFNEDIHFIQKPFGINDVLSSINKVLAAG